MCAWEGGKALHGEQILSEDLDVKSVLQVCERYFPLVQRMEGSVHGTHVSVAADLKYEALQYHSQLKPGVAYTPLEGSG